MRKISLNVRWAILGVLILAVIGGVAFRFVSRKPASENLACQTGGAALYRCPMHPAVTSDKPDQCPICHMDLQKVDDEDLSTPECDAQNAPKSDTASAEATSEKKSGKVLYHCPMHPNVVTEQPGDCPICHMKLQKVDEDGGEEDSHSGHGHSVHGRAGFSLSLEKQQLIGVATAKVQKTQLESHIRATGSVAFDPDLFTAIEEYRQAMLTKQEMASSPYASLREQASELVHSSETRLKLLGLNSSQILQLASGMRNALSLLLPSGSAWVYAEVFEYEVGGIKPGQEIEVESPSVPGKKYTGKISSISPIVSGPTRTIRVRAQVPDPEGVLRPDTFLNVRIKVKLGQTLAVPEDAVLHSGGGAFVFLVKGEGRFEPRPVALGRRASEYYEVISGLQEGDSVVSAANFLIDSESRLRSALQTMQSAGGGGTDKPAGHSGH